MPRKLHAADDAQLTEGIDRLGHDDRRKPGLGHGGVDLHRDLGAPRQVPGDLDAGVAIGGLLLVLEQVKGVKNLRLTQFSRQFLLLADRHQSVLIITGQLDELIEVAHASALGKNRLRASQKDGRERERHTRAHTALPSKARRVRARVGGIGRQNIAETEAGQKIKTHDTTLYGDLLLGIARQVQGIRRKKRVHSGDSGLRAPGSAQAYARYKSDGTA